MNSDLSDTRCAAASPFGPDDIKGSSYVHWGGLPAALSVLDDFSSLRPSDSTIAAMFDQLDRLDAIEDRTPAAVANEFKFPPEELNRMNSPLLDGIWTMLNGAEPDGHSHFVVRSPLHDSVWLSRCVSPKPYPTSVHWLLNGFRSPASADDATNQTNHVIASTMPADADSRVTPAQACSGSSQVEALSLKKRVERSVLIAGATGQVEIMQSISQLCPFVNSAIYMDALTRAALLGHETMVRFLTASVNLNQTKIYTAWYSALRKGHTAIALHLLEKDEGSGQSMTASVALTAAAAAGHMQTVVSLIQRSPPFVRLDDAEALHQGVTSACDGAHPELVRYLLPLWRPNLPLPESTSAILAGAIAKGGADVLRCFIEHGPLQSWHAEFPRQLVLEGLQHGSLPVLQLLEQTVHDAREVFQFSAVHLKTALRCGDINVAFWVLEHQPTIAKVDVGEIVPVMSFTATPELFLRFLQVINAHRGPLIGSIFDYPEKIAASGVVSLMDWSHINDDIPGLFAEACDVGNLPAIVHAWKRYHSHILDKNALEYVMSRPTAWAHAPVVDFLLSCYKGKMHPLRFLSILTATLIKGYVASAEVVVDWFAAQQRPSGRCEARADDAVPPLLLSVAAGQWYMARLLTDVIDYDSSLPTDSICDVQRELRLLNPSDTDVPNRSVNVEDSKSASQLEQKAPGATDLAAAGVANVSHVQLNGNAQCRMLVVLLEMLNMTLGTFSLLDRALAMAARFGHTQAVSLLLTYGADPQAAKP